MHLRMHLRRLVRRLLRTPQSIQRPRTLPCSMEGVGNTFGLGSERMRYVSEQLPTFTAMIRPKLCLQVHSLKVMPRLGSLTTSRTPQTSPHSCPTGHSLQSSSSAISDWRMNSEQPRTTSANFPCPIRTTLHISLRVSEQLRRTLQDFGTTATCGMRTTRNLPHASAPSLSLQEPPFRPPSILLLHLQSVSIAHTDRTLSSIDPSPPHPLQQLRIPLGIADKVLPVNLPRF